jgi:hypothetical protein
LIRSADWDRKKERATAYEKAASRRDEAIDDEGYETNAKKTRTVVKARTA